MLLARDALRNMKESLTNRMKTVIEKYLMPLNEIQEMYINKKEYISLHPENVAPEDKIQNGLPFYL